MALETAPVSWLTLAEDNSLPPGRSPKWPPAPALSIAIWLHHILARAIRQSKPGGFREIRLRIGDGFSDSIEQVFALIDKLSAISGRGWIGKFFPRSDYDQPIQRGQVFEILKALAKYLPA